MPYFLGFYGPQAYSAEEISLERIGLLMGGAHEQAHQAGQAAAPA